MALAVPALPAIRPLARYSLLRRPRSPPALGPPCVPVFQQRCGLRSVPYTPPPAKRFPDFGFAFDIDGVLLRGNEVIPAGRSALQLLHRLEIPYILLTNGGGKHESERVAELSDKLQVPIDTDMFVQSHSPFGSSQLVEEYKDKPILVVGGLEDRCRRVAESYGYNCVVTPGDLLVANPEIWPFSQHLLPYYKTFSRPLPAEVSPHKDFANTLRIHAIFVYHDPRDWGLDATVMLDLLLSTYGKLGTLSSKNGNPDLPNKGYQQDRQPKVFFSNPDLWWAAQYPQPRLGQGGFREALEGLWTAVTGGENAGVQLQKHVIGKPHRETFEFAERKLVQLRRRVLEEQDLNPGLKRQLRTVYMIGDNPESDILGANLYSGTHDSTLSPPTTTDSPPPSPSLFPKPASKPLSSFGSQWYPILVQTGLHSNQHIEREACRPKKIEKNALEAVRWVLSARENWRMPLSKGRNGFSLKLKQEKSKAGQAE